MLPLALVSQFEDQCVLIAGDTHIDREVYGDVHRLAPEGPVPVLQITSKRSIPGGAANVARNISRLGGKAALYGFFEGDDASREILRELRAEGVQVLSAPPAAPFRLPERRRFFASNHQLIQILQRPAIDHYADSLPPLFEFVAGLPSRPRTVVVYDQGYGFVTRTLLDSVEALARDQGLKIIIDAHPEHVSWYPRADLYTFNAREIAAAAAQLGELDCSLERAGGRVAERLGSDVLVTRGSQGMTVFPSSGQPHTLPADPVPLADRAGAGDSVTAVLALGLSAGADLKSAAALANKAAATVVSKPGIAYLHPDELLNLFHPQISSLLRESVTVKQRLITEQLPEIEKVVRAIIQTYREHKTVYAFGNGGSAADANHFITELVGRFRIERKGLPAFSFSTNEILMTSIANDYGYESTFTRQVDTFVKPGDLVAAFSTSGKSENVVRAIHLAKEKGATTVGFTGSSAGSFPGLCDLCIRVPSDNTPRIQESHLVVVHIICELLEKELALTDSMEHPSVPARSSGQGPHGSTSQE